VKNVLRVSLIGLVLIVGAEWVQGVAYDHCNTSYISRLVSSYQNGTYCSSTGAGCVYCWDDDGASYCFGDLQTGTCGIDYQNLPW
jgi:hypothetical protein